MEIERLQKKASIMKGSCINGIRALKSKSTLLSWKYVQGVTASDFKCAFSHIFGEDVDTFIRTSSSRNECSRKENKNNVSRIANSSSGNKRNKSGISSSKSGNDIQSDGVDIRHAYDTDSLGQVENDDYNMFSMEKEHPRKLEYVNDTYLMEKDFLQSITALVVAKNPIPTSKGHVERLLPVLPEGEKTSGLARSEDRTLDLCVQRQG
ncbi:hypothetical protein Tco_0847257 [Tanacetum coccineum]